MALMEKLNLKLSLVMERQIVFTKMESWWGELIVYSTLVLKMLEHIIWISHKKDKEQSLYPRINWSLEKVLRLARKLLKAGDSITGKKMLRA